MIFLPSPRVMWRLTSALTGCADDPCNALCARVATAIDGCRPEWGLTWEAFGAESPADWRTQCQNEWDTVRVLVDLVIPRERYGEFQREAARFGDYRTESEPADLPATVRIAVRLGS